MKKEEFNHPCKETCSGWKQGYEKGKAEAAAEIGLLHEAIGQAEHREVALKMALDAKTRECEKMREALEKISGLFCDKYSYDPLWVAANAKGIVSQALRPDSAKEEE